MTAVPFTVAPIGKGRVGVVFTNTLTGQTYEVFGVVDGTIEVRANHPSTKLAVYPATENRVAIGVTE